MSTSNVAYRPSAKVMSIGVLLALLGAAVSVVAAPSDPQRACANLLIVSNYLLGIGLGSAVLVALFYATGASWSVVLRRVPEAMTVLLIPGAVGLASVLLAYPSLYPWDNATGRPAESLSPFQSTWFTRPFFLLRSVGYLVVWIAFAFIIVRNSRRQDRSDSLSPTVWNRRVSGLFLAVFAVTCWLSSTDWLMSLEPKWSSTIFGVYNFAGIFLSTLAAVCVAVIGLSWAGPLRTVLTRDHLHDLGTLLFGFSSFWMYIWFSQYLLIWYVNNPEETVYYRQRMQGDWQSLTLWNLGLNWALPFAVLLFRSAKRNSAILFIIAGAVLLGRWLDLYLLTIPSIGNPARTLGIAEAGSALAALGLAVFLVAWSLGRASLVPTRDPLFGEGHTSPVQTAEAGNLQSVSS
jgi:hypothetical protein